MIHDEIDACLAAHAALSRAVAEFRPGPRECLDAQQERRRGLQISLLRVETQLAARIEEHGDIFARGLTFYVDDDGRLQTEPIQAEPLVDHLTWLAAEGHVAAGACR